MKLCLVSDSEPICTAVKASCLPPNRISIFSLQGFLNSYNSLSEHGNALVKKATAADVVLIGWSLEQAPLINTLCYSIRKSKHFTPIVAICDGSREEMITALSTGVDDVTSLPLFIPLLQARVAAQKRVVKAVQLATSKRINKKLKKAVSQMPPSLAEESIPSPPKGDQAVRPITERPDSAMDLSASVLIETIGKAITSEYALHDKETGSVAYGPLQLDRHAYVMYMGGAEVDLTPKEFELLGFLIENGGQLCTRDKILEEVWGIDFETGTNLVDVYMHFVRKKLAEHRYDEMLETVRSQGYRLVDMEVSRAN